MTPTDFRLRPSFDPDGIGKGASGLPLGRVDYATNQRLLVQDKGFDVMILTNPDHESLVCGLGLKFRSNHYSFKGVFTGDAARTSFHKNDFFAFLEAMNKW